MREFQIMRTNDVPINFEGEVVAFASTNSGRGNNTKQRWTELTLYMTKSGKFVSESVGVSKVESEMNIVNAEVFDNINDALQFFRNRDGHFTWASNQILQRTQEKFPDLSFNFGLSV